MYKLFGAAFPLLLLAWGMWSCKDDVSGNGNIDAIVFPDSNISYGKQVEPLFLRGCAIPGGCHTSRDKASGLSLETYQEAMDRLDIIDPGNPNCKLVLSIAGTTPYTGDRRMPLYRPPLNENQIRGIRTWVVEGAQNN